jgi:3-hydroxyacyl-CoA dehydrogenase
MDIEQIRNIAVVGAGLMGHGIALDFAMAGFDVHLQDLDEPTIQEALKKIRASLQMLASVGLAPPDSIKNTLERIHGTVLLKSAASAADIVIESVFENLELKQRVFKELDQLCPAHTILASNTSGFPPSRLAAGTGRPDKVVVAHYFNPPLLLPLVEVVGGRKLPRRLSRSSATC